MSPIILNPSGISSNTLQSYITDAQRLLHDASYRFYTQQELTDYANKARRKVAAETGCTRQIAEGFPLAQGTSKIAFTDIVTTNRVIGILDAYLFYSPTTRYALRYYPYSQFSRSGSVVYSYNGPPVMWSQVAQTVYISPIPYQAYTADFDVSVEPVDLVQLTDVDTEIPSPFSECVKYYMCHLAKIKDQRRDEANEFLMDYMRERNNTQSSTLIRKLVGS